MLAIRNLIKKYKAKTYNVSGELLVFFDNTGASKNFVDEVTALGSSVVASQAGTQVNLHRYVIGLNLED